MTRRYVRRADLLIVVSRHLPVDRRERPDALRIFPPTALEGGPERGHAVLSDRPDFLKGREARLARRQGGEGLGPARVLLLRHGWREGLRQGHEGVVQPRDADLRGDG